VSLALVCNPRAGGATEATIAELRARLGAVTCYELDGSCDAAGCARAAIEGGAEIVIAAGGDGTVSAVATELIGHPRTHLGVLPIGTSNSFAAALGIPADLNEALELLATLQRRVIDAAIVIGPTDRRVMILHTMVGFHADTIQETTAEAKRRWGVLAYAASAMRRLAGLDPFMVQLTTADHVIRCRATAVAAANVAPLKTVLAHGPSHLLGDDGRVDLTIVAAETIAEAIATGVHLYRTTRDGEPATRDNVGSFSTTRVVIAADPPQRVLVDGEPFGETPITIETLPRALTVIAPPVVTAEGPPIEASLFGLPELEIDGTSVRSR
jgi:YegS/Rv2252/BmrU family lipid kinase